MPQSSLCDALQDIRNRTSGHACRTCDLPMGQPKIKSQPNDVSTVNLDSAVGSKQDLIKLLMLAR